MLYCGASPIPLTVSCFGVFEIFGVFLKIIGFPIDLAFFRYLTLSDHILCEALMIPLYLNLLLSTDI